MNGSLRVKTKQDIEVNETMGYKFKSPNLKDTPTNY